MKKQHKVRRGRLASRGTVSLSGCIPLLGAVLLPLFAGMLIYSAVQHDGWFAYVTYGVLSMLCVLMLLSVNWKIDFDDNGFTYRNILRISRRYRYRDITKIRGRGDLWIVAGRRVLTVDSMALNRRPFFRMLRLHARHAFEHSDTPKG